MSQKEIEMETKEKKALTKIEVLMREIKNIVEAIDGDMEDSGQSIEVTRDSVMTLCEQVIRVIANETYPEAYPERVRFNVDDFLISPAIRDDPFIESQPVAETVNSEVMRALEASIGTIRQRSFFVEDEVFAIESEKALVALAALRIAQHPQAPAVGAPSLGAHGSLVEIVDTVLDNFFGDKDDPFPVDISCKEPIKADIIDGVQSLIIPPTKADYLRTLSLGTAGWEWANENGMYSDSRAIGFYEGWEALRALLTSKAGRNV